MASAEVAGGPTLMTRFPRNGIMRNLSYLVGGQLTTWTLSVVYTVVVPRQIGPIGMGQLVTVVSATSIMSVVVGLGTYVLVVTQIARDPLSAGRNVASAITARLLLFIPAAGLMALYVHAAHFDGYQVALLVVATAALPFALTGQMFQAAFQGLERMQYLAYLNVIMTIVTTAGGIALVLLGFGVLGLVLLVAAAPVVGLAMSIYWARRHFDLIWRVDLAEVRRVAISSLPFWATAMFLTFYMWIDSVMLALLASPTEVGWYGVPTKLFGTLLFIPIIIGTATLARLTATFKEGRDSFRRQLTPIIQSTLVISLPIAAGTLAVAGPMVSLIYGRAYTESGFVLAILAVAIPATYLNIIVNQSLIASNRQIVWTKVMAFCAVINPLLNWFAIPAAHAAWHDASLGAAWSLVATEVLMAGAGLFLVRSYIDPALIGRVARAGLAAVTMGIVVHLAERYGLILQMALGLIIFLVLALPLRLLSPTEIALGRQYAARFRSLLMRSRPA